MESYFYFISNIGQTSDFPENLWINSETIILITIIFGLLNCFLGFKLYRIFFSTQVFIATILIIIYLLRNVGDWGAVVTAFSILSPIFAFVAFHWKKLGAFIVSGFFLCCFLMTFNMQIEYVLIIGVVYAIISVQMPVETLVVGSALLGSRLVALSVSDIVNVTFGTTWILMVILFVMGGVIQFLTNRKQNLLIDENWEIFRRLEKAS